MYFSTDNDFTISALAMLLTHAAESGKRVRLDVDSKGRLKYKLGEGMWSGPIDSTEDPYRDL